MAKLAAAFCSCCCSVFVLVIMVVVFAALFPSRIELTFLDLRVAALNATSHDLTFTIRARNPNGDVAVRYQYLRVELWYQGYKIGMAADPAFHQGHRGVDRHSLRLWTPQVPPGLMRGSAGDAFRADLAGGVVPMRAQITARYRFHRKGWNSWKLREHLYCDYLSVSPPSAPWGGRLLAVSCYSKEELAAILASQNAN